MAWVIPVLVSIAVLLSACAPIVVPPRSVTIRNESAPGRSEGGGRDQLRRPADEIDDLRRQNEALQRQLDAVMREREEMKRQQGRGPYLEVPGSSIREGMPRQGGSHPSSGTPDTRSGGAPGETRRQGYPPDRPEGGALSLPPPRKAEAEQAIRRWKVAWEQSLQGNYEDYFRWYAPEGFVQWEDGERREFHAFRRYKLGLSPKRHIAVELRDLQITTQDGKAVATFYQVYDSISISGDRYHDEGRKTLHLLQTPAGPRIAFERWEQTTGSPTR